MAVLIEAISVVMRGSALEEKYPGGWSAFERDPPNRTLCADGELVRVGFMDPREVAAFVARLKGHGLVFAGDAEDSDFVVIDQNRGPTTACPWVEASRVYLDDAKSRRITVAYLVGSTSPGFVSPDGWSYEDSLFAQDSFVESGDPSGRLRYLRTEAGLDVFLDEARGCEMFKPGVGGSKN
jgi:hypothetical protein